MTNRYLSSVVENQPVPISYSKILPNNDSTIDVCVCLMVFNATFNNISVNELQVYHGGQFYWWRKLHDPD
jgi:hypothetical protein